MGANLTVENLMKDLEFLQKQSDILKEILTKKGHKKLVSYHLSYGHITDINGYFDDNSIHQKLVFQIQNQLNKINELQNTIRDLERKNASLFNELSNKKRSWW